MIEHYSFGKFVIDKKEFTSDIKIINNTVKLWKPKQSHLLKLDDIQDLLDLKPKILVIGAGYSGFFKVDQDLISLLKSNNITTIIKSTKEAIIYYNKLIQNEKNVVAILHATC